MRLFILIGFLFNPALLFSSVLQAQIIEHEMGQIELTSSPQKIVALDWVIAESLLALDITPYAMADKKGYQEWVQLPAVPESVYSVGSRREPNLELLAQLKPDLIIMSQHLSPAFEKLSSIAPTVVMSVYSNKKDPYHAAEDLLRNLGNIVERPEKADQVINETKLTLVENADRLRQAKQDTRALLMVRLIGDKHLRVHGNTSLAGQTLANMGLTNAWQGETNLWGFVSIGLEKLADKQQANLIYFGPIDDKYKQTFFATPLWKAMAFSREKRVYELPPVWTFGGLKSAQRLSNSITALLLSASDINKVVRK
ncbi:ABC transporter substrate-binding protein [Photobacterium profundum]|uniref:ABC transporter substrate-binding protein n=1 Tax=Photobacterium profundum TaxID=74109 RepID=UPI003D1459AD